MPGATYFTTFRFKAEGLDTVLQEVKALQDAVNTLQKTMDKLSFKGGFKGLSAVATSVTGLAGAFAKLEESITGSSLAAERLVGLTGAMSAMTTNVGLSTAAYKQFSQGIISADIAAKNLRKTTAVPLLPALPGPVIAQYRGMVDVTNALNQATMRAQLTAREPMALTGPTVMAGQYKDLGFFVTDLDDNLRTVSGEARKFAALPGPVQMTEQFAEATSVTSRFGAAFGQIKAAVSSAIGSVSQFGTRFAEFSGLSGVPADLAAAFQKIPASIQATMGSIGGLFKEIGQVSGLSGGITRVSNAFRQIGPTVSSVTGQVSRFVGDFSRIANVSGILERVRTGFGKIIPSVADVGVSLRGITAGMAQFNVAATETAAKFAVGFARAAVSGLGGLTKGLAQAVAGLGKLGSAGAGSFTGISSGAKAAAGSIMSIVSAAEAAAAALSSMGSAGMRAAGGTLGAMGSAVNLGKRAALMSVAPFLGMKGGAMAFAPLATSALSGIGIGDYGILAGAYSVHESAQINKTISTATAMQGYVRGRTYPEFGGKTGDELIVASNKEISDKIGQLVAMPQVYMQPAQIAEVVYKASAAGLEPLTTPTGAYKSIIDFATAAQFKEPEIAMETIFGQMVQQYGGRPEQWTEKQWQHQADILTQFSNASLMQGETINDALKSAGPVGEFYGQTQESMLASIATLRQMGRTPTQAGTDYRRMLLRLTPSLSQAQKAEAADLGLYDPDKLAAASKAVDALNLSWSDLQGKDLPEAFKTIGTAMDKLGMDAETRQQVFKDIFGLQGVTPAMGLMKLTEMVDNYKRIFGDVDGVATNAVQTIYDNLAGVGTKLLQVGNWMAKQFGDYLTPPIKTFTEFLTAKTAPALSLMATNLARGNLSLAASGLAQGWGAITDQVDKAWTKMEIILTSGTKWKELGLIGSNAITVLEDSIGSATDKFKEFMVSPLGMTKGIENIAGTIKEMYQAIDFEQIKDSTGDVITGLGAGVNQVIDQISQQDWEQIARDVGGVALNVLSQLGGAIQQINWGPLIESAKGAISGLTGVVGDWVQNIQWGDVGSAFGRAVQEGFKLITFTGKEIPWRTITQGLGDFVKGAFDGLTINWQSAVSGLHEAIQAAAQGITIGFITSGLGMAITADFAGIGLIIQNAIGDLVNGVMALPGLFKTMLPASLGGGTPWVPWENQSAAASTTSIGAGKVERQVQLGGQTVNYEFNRPSFSMARAGSPVATAATELQAVSQGQVEDPFMQWYLTHVTKPAAGGIDKLISAVKGAPDEFITALNSATEYATGINPNPLEDQLALQRQPPINATPTLPISTTKPVLGEGAVPLYGQDGKLAAYVTSTSQVEVTPEVAVPPAPREYYQAVPIEEEQPSIVERFREFIAGTEGKQTTITTKTQSGFITQGGTGGVVQAQPQQPREGEPADVSVVNPVKVDIQNESLPISNAKLEENLKTLADQGISRSYMLNTPTGKDIFNQTPALFNKYFPAVPGTVGSYQPRLTPPPPSAPTDETVNKEISSTDANTRILAKNNVILENLNKNTAVKTDEYASYAELMKEGFTLEPELMGYLQKQYPQGFGWQQVMAAPSVQAGQPFLIQQGTPESWMLGAGPWAEVSRNPRTGQVQLGGQLTSAFQGQIMAESAPKITGIKILDQVLIGAFNLAKRYKDQGEIPVQTPAEILPLMKAILSSTEMKEYSTNLKASVETNKASTEALGELAAYFNTGREPDWRAMSSNLQGIYEEQKKITGQPPNPLLDYATMSALSPEKLQTQWKYTRLQFPFDESGYVQALNKFQQDLQMRTGTAISAYELQRTIEQNRITKIPSDTTLSQVGFNKQEVQLLSDINRAVMDADKNLYEGKITTQAQVDLEQLSVDFAIDTLDELKNYHIKQGDYSEAMLATLDKQRIDLTQYARDLAAKEKDIVDATNKQTDSQTSSQKQQQEQNEKLMQDLQKAMELAPIKWGLNPSELGPGAFRLGMEEIGPYKGAYAGLTVGWGMMDQAEQLRMDMAGAANIAKLMEGQHVAMLGSQTEYLKYYNNLEAYRGFVDKIYAGLDRFFKSPFYTDEFKAEMEQYAAGWEQNLPPELNRNVYLPTVGQKISDALATINAVNAIQGLEKIPEVGPLTAAQGLVAAFPKAETPYAIEAAAVSAEKEAPGSAINAWLLSMGQGITSQIPWKELAAEGKVTLPGNLFMDKDQAQKNVDQTMSNVTGSVEVTPDIDKDTFQKNVNSASENITPPVVEPKITPTKDDITKTGAEAGTVPLKAAITSVDSSGLDKFAKSGVLGIKAAITDVDTSKLEELASSEMPVKTYISTVEGLDQIKELEGTIVYNGVIGALPNVPTLYGAVVYTSIFTGGGGGGGYYPGGYYSGPTSGYYDLSGGTGGYENTSYYPYGTFSNFSGEDIGTFASNITGERWGNAGTDIADTYSRASNVDILGEGIWQTAGIFPDVGALEAGVPNLLDTGALGLSALNYAALEQQKTVTPQMVQETAYKYNESFGTLYECYTNAMTDAYTALQEGNDAYIAYIEGGPGQTSHYAFAQALPEMQNGQRQFSIWDLGGQNMGTTTQQFNYAASPTAPGGIPAQEVTIAQIPKEMLIDEETGKMYASADEFAMDHRAKVEAAPGVWHEAPTWQPQEGAYWQYTFGNTPGVTAKLDVGASGMGMALDKYKETAFDPNAWMVDPKRARTNFEILEYQRGKLSTLSPAAQETLAVREPLWTTLEKDTRLYRGWEGSQWLSEQRGVPLNKYLSQEAWNARMPKGTVIEDLADNFWTSDLEKAAEFAARGDAGRGFVGYIDLYKGEKVLKGGVPRTGVLPNEYLLPPNKVEVSKILSDIPGKEYGTTKSVEFAKLNYLTRTAEPGLSTWVGRGLGLLGTGLRIIDPISKALMIAEGVVGGSQGKETTETRPEWLPANNPLPPVLLGTGALPAGTATPAGGWGQYLKSGYRYNEGKFYGPEGPLRAADINQAFLAGHPPEQVQQQPKQLQGLDSAKLSGIFEGIEGIFKSVEQSLVAGKQATEANTKELQSNTATTASNTSTTRRTYEPIVRMVNGIAQIGMMGEKPAAVQIGMMGARPPIVQLGGERLPVVPLGGNTYRATPFLPAAKQGATDQYGRTFNPNGQILAPNNTGPNAVPLAEALGWNLHREIASPFDQSKELFTMIDPFTGKPTTVFPAGEGGESGAYKRPRQVKENKMDQLLINQEAAERAAAGLEPLGIPEPIKWSQPIEVPDFKEKGFVLPTMDPFFAELDAATSTVKNFNSVVGSGTPKIEAFSGATEEAAAMDYGASVFGVNPPPQQLAYSNWGNLGAAPTPTTAEPIQVEVPENIFSNFSWDDMGPLPTGDTNVENTIASNNMTTYNTQNTTNQSFPTTNITEVLQSGGSAGGAYYGGVGSGSDSSYYASMGYTGNDYTGYYYPDYWNRLAQASYDIGTSNVPATGIYKLHKNERVLTPEQNIKFTPIIDAMAGSDGGFKSLNILGKAQRGAFTGNLEGLMEVHRKEIIFNESQVNDMKRDIASAAQQPIMTPPSEPVIVQVDNRGSINTENSVKVLSDHIIKAIEKKKRDESYL